MRRTWGAFLIVTSLCNSISGDTEPFIMAPNSDLELFHKFASDSSKYITLKLANDSQTLYIGGRNKIFGQKTSDIRNEAFAPVSWPALRSEICKNMPQNNGGKNCYSLIQIVQPLNSTHILICGTNYLKPENKMLVKTNGGYVLTNLTRDQSLCSGDPDDSVTSLILPSLDGPNIFSTPRPSFSKMSLVKKTHTSFLISNDKLVKANKPTFVASFAADDTVATPTMSKVYVVSDDKPDEVGMPAPAPTITQVCANDIGGKNLLSDMWTSLLRVRLRCESTDEYPLEFDLVTDMVKGSGGIIYGTFTTRHDTSRSNAVCAFRLYDIQRSFNTGDFWRSGTAPGNLRPGMCAYPGMISSEPSASTSKDFPITFLSFMSTHDLIKDIVKPAYPPSMDGSVKSLSRGPLFIKLGNKFTKIAVEQVTSLNNVTYDVMFVGKESGHIHKFLSIVKNNSLETIELAQYHPTTHQIISMEHSQKLGQLYIGTEQGVYQLSTSNCEAYTKSCEFCDSCSMCILSRDPSCAWDTSTQGCISIKNINGDGMLQDIQHGNAVTLCGKPKLTNHVLIRVAEGASDVLGNVIKNPAIHATWYKVKDASTKTKEKVSNKNQKFRITTDGQLYITNFDSSTDSATYECQYTINSSVVSIMAYDVMSSSSYSPSTPIITEPPPAKTVKENTDDTTGQPRTGNKGIPETGTDNKGIPETTTPASHSPISQATLGIGLSVALVLILAVAIVLLVLFCRSKKKYSPGREKDTKKTDVRMSSPTTIENATNNNNNAGLGRMTSEYDDRASRPLMSSLAHQAPAYTGVESNRTELPSSSQARNARSLNNILDGRDEVKYIDEDAASDDGVTRQSSRREKTGRTRVPPQRTKSMPGSALYVVYAGKKLKCSTLQRNKQGTWTIELRPNESGMSDMTAEQDEVIDIINESEHTNTFLPCQDRKSADESKIFGTPGNVGDMKGARKAFFEGSDKEPGNDSSTVQYVTSTPNNCQDMPKPKVAPKPVRLMSDRRKHPLKEQTSIANFGHNSSEDRDSDSTGKGSSVTLKPVETPPPALNSPSGQTNSHRHQKTPDAVVAFPTEGPISDVFTPRRNKSPKILEVINQHANPNSFNSSIKSLDRSSGSSDGDEHLHGRDKDVKRTNCSMIPDSPSKQSRTSQGSSSSGDYRSARSSVISEQSHEQR